MNKLMLGISVSTIALASPALAQELAPPAPPSETSSSVATTGSGTSNTATGVNEGGGNLGDIIVTAQRRAQNVQDVPIAVSAFDTTELARRQITRTLDIVQYVPNMEGHNNTTVGTANTYSLRALNNTESIPTFDPPVGTYVDDIYISRQGANNISFFDVERVEVLRGPQGTLFGRNTTGGAINIIVRKPGDELKGYAEVGYGKYDRKQARASIDIPLSDKILTKFSGYYAKDDGYVRNLTTGQKFNFEDSYGLRGAVRFLLNDKIKWDVSGEYDDNNLSNVINFTRPGSKKRIGFTRQLQGVTLGDRGLTFTPQLADQSIGNRAYTQALTSNVELELDDRTTANFIFGYRNLHQEIFSDSFDSLSSAGVTFAVDGSLVNTGTGAVLGSASGFGIVNTPVGTSTPGVADQSSKQYSQEVKLTGKLGDQFEYVAGFYYFNERNNTYLANINLPAVGNPTLTQERNIRNTTVAYAGYLQVDFKPTDTLTFTVGARYTDEVKRFGIQTLPSPAAAQQSDVQQRQPGRAGDADPAAAAHVAADAALRGQLRGRPRHPPVRLGHPRLQVGRLERARQHRQPGHGFRAGDHLVLRGRPQVRPARPASAGEPHRFLLQGEELPAARRLSGSQHQHHHLHHRQLLGLPELWS